MSPNNSALLALARSAGANNPEATPILRLVSADDVGHSAQEKLADFAHATDATNFLLAGAECPPELRPLVDALIGLAGDRTDWFIANDKQIAARLHKSTKTVQRYRDNLSTWQLANGYTLIEVEDNYMDRDGQKHPHKYRVHVARLAIEATQNACAARPDNPSRAIERAAQAKVSSIPSTTPLRRRGKKREPDAESIINRSLRAAQTLITKAAKLQETVKMQQMAHGSATDFHIDSELLAGLQQSISALTSASLSTYTEDKKVDTGGALVFGGVVDKMSTTPTPHVENAGVSEDSKQGSGQNVHIEAIQPRHAVEIFESVGVESFKVILRDEERETAIESRELKADALKAELRQYLKSNAGGRESFIVRPILPDDGSMYARHLIQVDEASPELLKMLAPVSFLQIETSEGNGQAWLALDGSNDAEEFARTRARLLRQLQPHGANGGAYGATRWPGSLNCKPSRRRADGSFPIVKIVFYQHGRQTTVGELKSLNLLAPPVSSSIPAKPYKPAERAERPRQWPSYQIELDRAARRTDGKPDRSDADINFALRCVRWGWSEDETAARLCEVSGKAKKQRGYAARTARRAVQIVGH
jgi:hypothetical protein